MHQTAHNLFCLPTEQDWTTLVQSLVESGCTLTAQVQVDTVFIPFTYTLFLPCELQNMKFFERISLSLKFVFFLVVLHFFAPLVSTYWFSLVWFAVHFMQRFGFCFWQPLVRDAFDRSECCTNVYYFQNWLDCHPKFSWWLSFTDSVPYASKRSSYSYWLLKTEIRNEQSKDYNIPICLFFISSIIRLRMIKEGRTFDS